MVSRKRESCLLNLEVSVDLFPGQFHALAAVAAALIRVPSAGNPFGFRCSNDETTKSPLPQK